MFGLEDLKQTRFYQQAKEEGKLEGKEEGKLEGKLEGQEEGKIQGKLESIPGLLAIGLSVEQIAAALGLDVEIVRQVAQGQSYS
jgi:predicted transposase/invertase (TIGR01784 family)